MAKGNWGCVIMWGQSLALPLGVAIRRDPGGPPGYVFHQPGCTRDVCPYLSMWDMEFSSKSDHFSFITDTRLEPSSKTMLVWIIHNARWCAMPGMVPVGSSCLD
ncbi:hypothetical protein DSO57_1003161 [Entomophthora muscae]|uniref:Uncharacterized protein n=1 Tax=Entomophthora muscae TaxID=34485 RepID=A0ACC2RNR4_9FUNG|nr:hypothetical protein DSO57_1003161 [Entomophthora muscae]